MIFFLQSRRNEVQEVGFTWSVVCAGVGLCSKAG